MAIKTRGRASKAVDVLWTGCFGSASKGGKGPLFCFAFGSQDFKIFPSILAQFHNEALL